MSRPAGSGAKPSAASTTIAAKSQCRRDKAPLFIQLRNVNRLRRSSASVGVGAMDVASIASALLAASIAQTQLAVAAKLAKMQADNGKSVVQLTAAADQNMSQLVAAAQGLGQNIDISA